LAIELAAAKKDTGFCVFELGASYAPWLVTAGVICERLGFSEVELIGVEATVNGQIEMRRHFENNGLHHSKNVSLTPIFGAVDTSDGVIFFPDVDTKSDNGAKVVKRVDGVDYRGLNLKYVEVPSFSLTTLTRDFDRIDFLHMDLQGIEETLLIDESFLTSLTQKVVCLFIATQTRFIEGVALSGLSKRGWSLVRERPTRYRMHNGTQDPQGWTTGDGGQFWINRKFVSEEDFGT
jgi:hypothetical protein